MVRSGEAAQTRFNLLLIRLPFQRQRQQTQPDSPTFDTRFEQLDQLGRPWQAQRLLKKTVGFFG
jgi:hypothetical protein